MLRGANLPSLGDYNLRLVLDVIRRHPDGISRVAVGRATGLTPQTVSNIVRRLADQGLVAEGERVRTARGKPPTLLHVEPARHVAVGIHIDPARVSALSMDLAGEVHRVASAPTPPEVTPTTAVAMVAELTTTVLADWPGAERQDAVLGIGVAAPGPVDLEHGSVHQPPQLHGWVDVPLQEALQAALGRPVLLDKDVIAAVTGEHWAPGGPRDDFLYVYLGSGLAVGVCLGGRVHRGTTNNAGEIAGLFEHGPIPSRLVAQAIDLGLLSRTPLSFPEVRPAFEELCRLADSDTRAGELLTDAAAELARGVGALVNVLDVGQVVLGGPSWPPVAQRWLDQLPSLVGRRLAARDHVQIDGSRLADQGSAYGAATLVLHHFLAPEPALHTV
ncbi:MAG TPA: ROK family transcriptional regulator [Microlunatus sp.]|nr:ROK family transcriptional regulator [Microlunatus sp.]